MRNKDRTDTHSRIRRPVFRRVIALTVRASGLGLTLVLLVLTVLYGLQTRLIFPGSATQGMPEVVITPPPGTERLTLRTAQGDRVVALFAPALDEHGTPHPDAPRRPTLLYFYGNGSCLSHVARGELDDYRRLGVNVLVPDYVGYGMSSGVPSERGCVATADAAYACLLTRADVDPSRIIVAGRSLGGAVAIDLASRSKVAGLIAFCTFTRMSDMVRLRFPFVPSSLLLRHKFDSLTRIAHVSCPILLGHGDSDRIVPSAMSGTLASAATAPVTRVTVAGADHNDFLQVGYVQVFKALHTFIEQMARGG